MRRPRRSYPYKRAVGPNGRTLDLNPAMEPDFLRDAREPYPQDFRAILADPPYSPENAVRYVPGAANYPLPNLIVKRAIDALPVGCRVRIIHYAWGAPPPNAGEAAVIAVGTGRNARARWFIVFEKLPWARNNSGSGTARRDRRDAKLSVSPASSTSLFESQPMQSSLDPAL